MRILKKFLRCVCLMVALWGTAAEAATSNISVVDIGDNGTWITESGAAAFTENLGRDMTEFAPTVPGADSGFVPIEARIGLAFMEAMSFIGDILENTLVRFMIAFIIIAYAFWVMFDTYQMMRDGGGKITEFVQNIFMKGILVAVWIFVITIGPAQLFMWIVGPIVAFGSYMADLILGAVTSAAGVALPDTCAAVHQYVAANAGNGLILDAPTAANLMCLPTRLSGFFYVAITTGWKWMISGIGHSMISFVAGAALIFVFVFNIWKFALMAFGVIADLFLALFMLPFTAVAETVPKTKYKGIAGDIFNGFLGVFKTQDLSKQITRFIDAAIYFVALSMIIAVAAALLGGIVTIGPDGLPTIGTDDGLVTLLAGFLVVYLVTRAEKLAGDIGGKINNSVGKQIGQDLKKLGQNARKAWTSWRKAITS